MSGAILSARALLPLALAALLAGCGWHAVYAPGANGGPGVAQSELPAITVDRIPDHPGVMLRQALQNRLEGANPGLAHRYDLSVFFSIGTEGVAIEPDNSTTRIRLIANAHWTLRAQDAAHTTLASGDARALDGFDLVNEQFFAANLNQETIEHRMANSVADQITLDLARYFDRRAKAGAHPL
jgi:LPS-assembly lipoprotein